MLTEPLRRCFFEQICKGSFGMLEKRFQRRFFIYVIFLPSSLFFLKPHYADNVAIKTGNFESEGQRSDGGEKT